MKVPAQHLQRFAKEVLANAKDFFSQSFALATACTAGACQPCSAEVNSHAYPRYRFWVVLLGGKGGLV